MSTYYGPPGESEETVMTEQVMLCDLALTCLLFGMNVMLCLASVVLLWRQRRRHPVESKVYIGYSLLMITLNLLCVISGMTVAVWAFVNNRNYPGGPTAYYMEVISQQPIYFMSDVLDEATYYIADGLLIWRCAVIWRGDRLRFLVLIPLLLYTGGFVLSVISLVHLDAPDGLLTSYIYLWPLFSIQLATNIIVTFLIVLRILLVRRRVIQAMGTKECSQYVSIIAMMVESAMLYAVFGICFLVTYILQQPVYIVWMDMMIPIQVMAPMLIVFRVALGRGWTSKTATSIECSVIQYAPHRIEDLQSHSQISSTTPRSTGQSQSHASSVTFPMEFESKENVEKVIPEL